MLGWIAGTLHAKKIQKDAEKKLGKQMGKICCNCRCDMPFDMDGKRSTYENLYCKDCRKEMAK